MLYEVITVFGNAFDLRGIETLGLGPVSDDEFGAIAGSIGGSTSECGCHKGYGNKRGCNLFH